METKESWEEIKGKGRVGEFLILDSLFFPAFAGHVTAVAGRAHARFRVDWGGDTHVKPRQEYGVEPLSPDAGRRADTGGVGGREHYGFMHNVEMCWKLDFDL